MLKTWQWSEKRTMGRINLDFTTYRTLLKGWAVLYRMCVKMWHKKTLSVHQSLILKKVLLRITTQNRTTSDQEGYWDRQKLQGFSTPCVRAGCCWSDSERAVAPGRGGPAVVPSGTGPRWPWWGWRAGSHGVREPDQVNPYSPATNGNNLL